MIGEDDYESDKPDPPPCPVCGAPRVWLVMVGIEVEFCEACFHEYREAP